MLLFSFALPLYAEDQEYAALKAYSNALSSGDLKKLDSLLSPDFEYHFYLNNKQRKLSRADELKSLERLFKDANLNRFNEPDLLMRDKRHQNKLRIKFCICFTDSPKVHTDSWFRGEMLDIDEVLTITMVGDKISKIFEQSHKDSISFGYIKGFHLRNIVDVSEELGKVYFAKLYDADTQELLMIKKEDFSSGPNETSYLWPNGIKIPNLN